MRKTNRVLVLVTAAGVMASLGRAQDAGSQFRVAVSNSTAQSPSPSHPAPLPPPGGPPTMAEYRELAQGYRRLTELQYQNEAQQYDLQARAAQALLQITRSVEEKLPDSDASFLRSSYRWARDTSAGLADIWDALNGLDAEAARLRQQQQQAQRTGDSAQLAALQREYQVLALRFGEVQALTSQKEAQSIAALIDVTHEAEGGFKSVAKSGVLDMVLKKQQQSDPKTSKEWWLKNWREYWQSQIPGVSDLRKLPAYARSFGSTALSLLREYQSAEANVERAGEIEVQLRATAAQLQARAAAAKNSQSAPGRPRATADGSAPAAGTPPPRTRTGRGQSPGTGSPTPQSGNPSGPPTGLPTLNSAGAGDPLNRGMPDNPPNGLSATGDAPSTPSQASTGGGATDGSGGAPASAGGGSRQNITPRVTSDGSATNSQPDSTGTTPGTPANTTPPTTTPDGSTGGGAGNGPQSGKPTPTELHGSAQLLNPDLGANEPSTPPTMSLPRTHVPGDAPVEPQTPPAATGQGEINDQDLLRRLDCFDKPDDPSCKDLQSGKQNTMIDGLPPLTPRQDPAPANPPAPPWSPYNYSCSGVPCTLEQWQQQTASGNGGSGGLGGPGGTTGTSGFDWATFFKATSDVLKALFPPPPPQPVPSPPPPPQQAPWPTGGTPPSSPGAGTSTRGDSGPNSGGNTGTGATGSTNSGNGGSTSGKPTGAAGSGNSGSGSSNSGTSGTGNKGSGTNGTGNTGTGTTGSGTTSGTNGGTTTGSSGNSGTGNSGTGSTGICPPGYYVNPNFLAGLPWTPGQTVCVPIGTSQGSGLGNNAAGLQPKTAVPGVPKRNGPSSSSKPAQGTVPQPGNSPAPGSTTATGNLSPASNPRSADAPAAAQPSGVAAVNQRPNRQVPATAAAKASGGTPRGGVYVDVSVSEDDFQKPERKKQ